MMMIKRRSDSTGQHERVQRARSMVKDKDEDLTLFQEMRNRELNSYLHPSKEDIEISLTTKFGRISGYRIMAPLTPKKGVNDLLASDAEKNDYNWLLTPPGTPLFPSLDQENTSLRQSLRDFSAHSASFTSSPRFSNLHEHTTSVVPRSISGIRQPGSGANAAFGTGISRVQSTSAPTVVSLSPSSRAPTPTRRSASPNRGKSNPSSARSKTPTSRPSTPPFKTFNPPVRAPTPTARSKTPNLRSSTPTMRRSFSSPVGSMNSSTRSSSSMSGNSPSRKSTSSLIALGLSLQPPPNLRTMMPERSTSTPRGASFTARTRANSSLLQAQIIDVLDLNICQQHPGSPHLSISSSSTSQETEVFSCQSSRDSVISPRQEVIGPDRIAQISSKPGSNPKKSRITQIDPSNSKAALHVRRFAKTSMDRPAFSGGQGHFKKSTEATWYKDIRQSTSRGFRPLMASNFTTFYTKSISLEEHPSSSLFENSVNNGSNASSEYGASLAPWTDYDDLNGEAVPQKDHSGSLVEKLTRSVEQVSRNFSHVDRHYEDEQAVVSLLEMKHVGDVFFPEDANLSESDDTQHLSLNVGMERNGDFQRGAYDAELENECDKKTICSSKCNVLLNLSTSCLKAKTSAASTGKDPTLHKDVAQNCVEQSYVNVVVVSEDEATGFPIVAGITGSQRTCAEDSKALDVVPQDSSESALRFELEVRQNFLICSDNRSSEFQFEDKMHMHINYNDLTELNLKLDLEGQEDCVDEKDVTTEINSAQVQCQSRLLDSNCSNSSMEIYQFNEQLELSSVETEMSSACEYAESPCLPPMTELDNYQSEVNDSSEHQSGSNSNFSEAFVQSATRSIIHPEIISAKNVCRTIYNLAKAGMNDKLYSKNPDGKALLSGKAQKGSLSKICNDHPVESMMWQIKGFDGAQTTDDCSDCQGLLKSHKSIVQTSIPSGYSIDPIISRLSAETENLEHCACLLHVEAEGVLIKESINSSAGYLEMLAYDREVYAKMDGRMSMDDRGDAVAQEKFCMTEPETALSWSPESIATVKEVANILMDEHEDIPLHRSGAEKRSYTSGEKLEALVLQDEADCLLENAWKKDSLLEEGQEQMKQMKGLEVCAEDVLSIHCFNASLSSSSNSHEPMHEEDTLIEALEPHTFDTTKETSELSGEDSDIEVCTPACKGDTTKATETAIMCTAIVDGLVSRAAALALEKEEHAAFATPASMKELVSLLGASETKRQIQNQTGIMEPGALNGLNVRAGSTVRRTLTYMQNQKVMQSATVGYLQSPIGKVKEDMRDEDDSMLAAFEIDESDDAATRTKQKCCCTIM